MLKVECYSGYMLNEKPVAFSLMERDYKVTDVIDRWYGEGLSYFKVKADDDNIYLLKYDMRQDHWDLILYQNPRKLESLPFANKGYNPSPYSDRDQVDRFTPLH